MSLVFTGEEFERTKYTSLKWAEFKTILTSEQKTSIKF